MSGERHDGDNEAEPRSYRPKLPLWRPAPEKPPSFRSLVAAGVVAALVALAGLVLLLEPLFLSVPVGQTEVTVVEVQGGRPADELPATYRHLVELADGSKLAFVSQEIHRPGERLIVTVARGRLTGRVRLGSPYRVASEPARPNH